MMPNINLLPWREWRRRRRNQLFLLQLGGVLAAALLALGGVGWRMQVAIEVQEGRNASLRKQNAVLDGRIAAVRRARQGRNDLLAQIGALQALDAERTSVPRIFDALAHTLPGGVHYRAVALQGNLLTLTGSAESGVQVAALMRNLEASPILAEARLVNLGEAEEGAATRVFQLTATRLATVQQGGWAQPSNQEPRGRP